MNITELTLRDCVYAPPTRGLKDFFTKEQGFDMAVTDYGVTITKGGKACLVPWPNVLRVEYVATETVARAPKAKQATA